MSPFLRSIDSHLKFYRFENTPPIVLCTWATKPFPHHHLSSIPVLADNLGSRQDAKARLMSGMCNQLFLTNHDCNIALHLQHQIRQTLLYLSTLTLFPQVTNSQTTFPRPESSHAPLPSLRTTTSKIMPDVEEPPQTSTEIFETTLEFETTEAFPRLDCGGRGFYQVGCFFNISIFS